MQKLNQMKLKHGLGAFMPSGQETDKVYSILQLPRQAHMGL